jgi:hypothetical protein
MKVRRTVKPWGYELLFARTKRYAGKVLAIGAGHHLAEATAALPLLAPRCLVLVDDTSLAGEPGEDGMPSFRGKGALAAPFLLERGFRLEWAEGGQALLSRGVA